MRYFITHVTPKQFVEKYQSSISGGNFSYNLKDAGLFDVTYSILPTNIYRYAENLDIDDIHIVYSNIRSKYLFSRLIGCLVEQWSMYRIIKRNSTVWFYNITILNCLLFCLLKLFKRSVGIYVIEADFTPGSDLLTKFNLYLTNKSDGLITLSNSPLFTLKNLRVIPGIVPTNYSYTILESPLSRKFLLSGALNEWIASTSKVIKVFSALPQLQLEISGRASDSGRMLQCAKKLDNVKYYGVLGYDEFQDLLESCTFILSSRDPSYPENQCNFPSKVLEALLHNRIIISTIHYPQLDGIKYFVIPCDEKGMQQSIKEISLMNDDDLLDYANQGEKVKKMFGSAVWKKEIESLENNHGK